MSESLALLYGSDAEFAAAFQGWRKPASEPVRRLKLERNPFTCKSHETFVYEFEFPFAEGEEFTGILDRDAMVKLSIAEHADIPLYFFEELGLDGPPLLCRPPDIWNTALIEILPDRIEELLNGKIEKRLLEADLESAEEDKKLFCEIREQLATRLKKGGRLAVYLGPFEG